MLRKDGLIKTEVFLASLHFKNKNGFSLVEVLAALGITTILALALASTMGFLGAHKKNIELSQEANELVDDIRNTIRNGSDCETMLIGQNIDTSGVPVAVTLNVKTRGSVTPVPFSAGTAVAPGIGIASLNLKLDMNTATKDVIVDDAGTMRTMTLYPAMIQIEFQKSSFFNSKPVSIPLKVYTESGSTAIEKCVAQEMRDATDCVEIGYKWDYATSRCLPTGRCLYGGSYSTSPQGGFSNPLTGSPTCPAGGGYTAYQSGVINYSTDCGKSCVSANIHPVMSCLRCVDATGADRVLSANANGATANDVDFSTDLDSDSQILQDQFNQILANLTRDASQPDFVCKPSGTTLTGTPSSCIGVGESLAVQAQSAPAYCCSASVSVCTISFDLSAIGAGTYSAIKYMTCQ